MDVGMLVPAIGKLADYCASGIGSAVGHLFAGRIARREVEKKLIVVKGDAEVQTILAEAKATSISIIAEAQSEARRLLVSPNANVQGEVVFDELITQRIQFQEEKRQANIGSVIEQAAFQLEGSTVQDHEPDHDWTARFFNDVQDVSSEEMQTLWAKVLAGEVERPGSTSIKTLSILKNLDKTSAKLFRLLCSACLSITLDGNSFVDARVPSLGGNAGANALKEYGLGFSRLNLLNEHGLIISDYNSWYDIQSSVGIPMGDNDVVHIPINFQNKYWILVSKTQQKLGKQFKLSGVALTKSGQELSRIVGIDPMQQFTLDLIQFFGKKSLNMIEVASWQPQIMSKAWQ